MSILFTQYKMPHGFTEDVTTDSTPEIEAKAHELLDFGFKFDIEMLSTGMISMTCEKEGEEDEIVAIELSENGPEIREKLISLVNTAYSYWKEEHPELQKSDDHNWRKRMQAVIDARSGWEELRAYPHDDDNYPVDLSDFPD